MIGFSRSAGDGVDERGRRTDWHQRPSQLFRRIASAQHQLLDQGTPPRAQHYPGQVNYSPCCIHTPRQSKSLKGFFCFLIFSFFEKYSAKYSIDGERGSSSPGYKTSMTLFIHDFQPEDRSVYICVAANSLGTAEASIQIYGTVTSVFIFLFCFFF